MGFTERIAVIIDSSHKGAVRGLNETGLAAGEMGKKTTSARGALALLDKTGLGATGTLGKLRAGIQQTGTLTGGLEKSGIGLGKALGVGVAGGAVAAGSALAAFAIDGVGKFETATGEVRKLNRTMGTTAEDASRLRYASNRLGIDLDAVGRGAGLMAKSIGSGTSKLGDFGVEVAHTKDGSVDMSGTLANVAQAFQSTTDPARRAAIGAAAFGKGWQAMAPLLSKSKSELTEIYKQADQDHQVFNADELEKGRKLAVTSKELNQAIQGLEIEVGEGLVPVLTQMAHGLTTVTRGADELLGPLGGTANVIGSVTDAAMNSFPPLGLAKSALDLFGGSSNDAADKAKKHAVAEKDRASALENSRAAADLAAEASKKEADAVVAETNAVIGSFDSNIAAQQATQNLAETLKTSTDPLERQKAALDAAGAAAHLAEEQYTGMTGQAFDAGQKNQALQTALMNVAAQFPQMAPVIAGYVQQLQAIPISHPTTITVDASQAHAELDKLRAAFKDIGGDITTGSKRGRLDLRF